MLEGGIEHLQVIEMNQDRHTCRLLASSRNTRLHAPRKRLCTVKHQVPQRVERGQRRKRIGIRRQNGGAWVDNAHHWRALRPRNHNRQSRCCTHCRRGSLNCRHGTWLRCCCKPHGVIGHHVAREPARQRTRHQLRYSIDTRQVQAH